MRDVTLLLKNLRCYKNDIEILEVDVATKGLEQNFNATIQCSLVGDSPKEACKKWIAEFSKATHTNWIVRRTCPSPKRHAFRISYDCQHSNYQKRKGTTKYTTRERNKDCKASIKMVVKQINRNTIKNDKFLKKGLNTLITINFNHNHNVEVAEAFSYLRMDTSTEASYIKYFKDGMTPSAARIYHEICLIQSELDEKNIPFILADAQKNPRERQVKYLYDKWRQVNYGDRTEISVVQVLKEKQEEFSTKGIEVHVQESPLIITIVTPIMKRVARRSFAKEVAFVDSSGSCDQTNTCITFLFTASKIGAIPLAVVLHTAQTEGNYTLAFASIKDIFIKNGMADEDCPRVFLTDDSQAERSALRSVFPTSVLLLCTFHMCQAFWRWLWDAKHNIHKHHRKAIMLQFQELMYAKTQEDCEELFSSLVQYLEEAKYKNLKDHLDDLWDRRKEWCLCYRINIITRGNNTNNYAEASIRIFKDIVLQRCRVFNACALIEFIIDSFENYHKRRRRLLEFSNSRRSEQELAYMKFVSKTKDLLVSQIDESYYHVTSKTDSKMLYTVFSDIAMCDCPFGQSGRFCKHICAVQEKCKIFFKTAPLLTTEDKTDFAKIALGDSVSANFYKSMNDTRTTNESYTETFEIFQKNSFDLGDVHGTVQDSIGECHRDDKIHEEAVATLSRNFLNIAEIAAAHKSPTMTEMVIRFNRYLENITTPAQVEHFFAKAKTNLSRKIGVQPTSVSRRKTRSGLTSGRQRIQAGRPSNNELQQSVASRKRKRRLTENIMLNRPNAKSHGTNH